MRHSEIFIPNLSCDLGNPYIDPFISLLVPQHPVILFFVLSSLLYPVPFSGHPFNLRTLVLAEPLKLEGFLKVNFQGPRLIRLFFGLFLLLQRVRFDFLSEFF